MNENNAGAQLRCPLLDTPGVRQPSLAAFLHTCSMPSERTTQQMPVVSRVSAPSGPQAVPARLADSCTMLILHSRA